MGKHILLVGIVPAVLLFSSCQDRVIKGEGAVTTNTAKVTPFKSVQVELPLKVSITVLKGATPSVKFTGFASFLIHIKTKVEDGMLFISSDMDDRMALDSKTVIAEITMPQLTELYISSTADADVHGNVTGKAFKTEVTGKSNIMIEEINTDNFFYTASGGANLEVKGGTAKIATYSEDEACTIKAFPLQTTETSVTIKGAGKAQVTALKKLSTNVAASGDVKYKGHPSILKNPEGGTIDNAN